MSGTIASWFSLQCTLVSVNVYRYSRWQWMKSVANCGRCFRRCSGNADFDKYLICGFTHCRRKGSILSRDYGTKDHVRQHDLVEFWITQRLTLQPPAVVKLQPRIAHTNRNELVLKFSYRTWNNQTSFGEWVNERTNESICIFVCVSVSYARWLRTQKQTIKDDSQAKTWTQYPNKRTNTKHVLCTATSTEWFIDIFSASQNTFDSI